MSDESTRGRTGPGGSEAGRVFERGGAHVEQEAQERDLGARERDVAAREREVAERDQELSSRDRDVADRDEELKSRDRELAARDEELKSRGRDSDAGDRDRGLGDRARAAVSRDRDDDHDRSPKGATSPRERYDEMRDRQRAEYGGLNLGAAFFGWLVAVGLGALLTALLSAVGAGVGLTNPPSASDAAQNAGTIGIAGGIALLVVLFLAYYAGGYVAGRMSRFNGAKQGFGVWLIALAVTLVLAGLGAIAGAEFNVLSQLNLPRIPVNEGSLATSGIIALVAIVLVTLVAAVLGGKLGVRYHKKVDRAGLAA